METNATSAGRRPKLLLVDDDGVTRGLLAQCLAERGYHVVAVGAAEEGIVEAGETGFDAVVTDVHLPGRSGLDLASYLLAQDPELPIILITGDTDEQLARDALSRGPLSYLVKPVAPFELESVVQQALTRRGWRVGPGGQLAPRTKPSAGTTVPEEWLDYVESESYAGPGHGDRVARIARILCEELEPDQDRPAEEDLALSARTHEVGRLRSPDAESVLTAVGSAELMAEAGFPRPAVRAVRHVFEHWDGSGGPDGLREAAIPVGARILAVADAVDHYAAAWLRSGLNSDNAIDRSVHLVTVQQGRVFEPALISGLHKRIEDVRRVISSALGSHEETVTTAAFATDLSDVPFKVA